MPEIILIVFACTGFLFIITSILYYCFADCSDRRKRDQALIARLERVKDVTARIDERDKTDANE